MSEMPRFTSGPVYSCTYCGAPLSSQTPHEHIIPEAVGGRKRSRRIACETCNRKLGEKLDVHLANWGPVVWCRNLFEIRGKKGHVPSFDVVGPDGRQLRIEPGLRPGFTPRPPTIEETPSSFRIVASARSAQEAEKSVHKILEKKMARLQGVYSDLEASWEIRQETYAPASELHSEVVYDPDLLSRIAAKICLNFAAWTLPNCVIRSSSFDPIRRFIMDGVRITGLRPAQLEYRRLLRLPRCADSLAHRVALSCNSETRSAVGWLELFGKLSWAVVLSWNYEGPDTSTILTEVPARRWEEPTITEASIGPIPVEAVLRQSPEELQSQEERFRNSLEGLSVATSAIAAHEDIKRFVDTVKDGSDMELKHEDIGDIVSAFAEQANVLVTRFIAQRMARTFAKELVQRTTFLLPDGEAHSAAVRKLAASVQRAAHAYTLAFMLRVVLTSRLANEVG